MQKMKPTKNVKKENCNTCGLSEMCLAKKNEENYQCPRKWRENLKLEN